MVVRLLIVSILAPAVAAGAVAAVWRLLPPASWQRRAVAPLVLTTGYVAGHVAVAGAPSLPPVDTTQSLFYLALVAGALAVVEARVAGATGLWAAQVVAVVATLGFVLHPLVRYQWTAGQMVVRSAALGVVALALGWATRALAARLPAIATLAGGLAVFAGTATLLVLARTALLAQLAAGVAIALAVLLAFGAAGAAQRDATAVAAVPFLTPMLLALVLNGLLYAELDVRSAAALALSPLAAALALAVARHRGPRLQAAAALLGVLLLLAPFVAAAAMSYAADDRGYDDYYGE